jgi:hypothetical protein
MQPEILSFSSPISRMPSPSAKRCCDLLRDRDRAGIGEAAIIEAGAGDDVADQIEIGRCQRPPRLQLLPQRVQIAFFDMRQHDVLGVGDAQLVKAVRVGEVGHHIDLLGGRIAGDAAESASG